jgi:hypothetical protein
MDPEEVPSPQHVMELCSIKDHRCRFGTPLTDM